MTATPIYAGILAILFIFLSARVIEARRSIGVALGDGGDRQLLRRQRAHANFSEYVPIALILLALVELQGMPHWLLHATGAALLLGRLSHAYALSHEPEPMRFRVLGMLLTFAALLTGAIGTLSFVLSAALSGTVCTS